MNQMHKLIVRWIFIIIYFFRLTDSSTAAAQAALLGIPTSHTLTPNYLNSFHAHAAAAAAAHVSPTASLRLQAAAAAHAQAAAVQNDLNAAAQRLGELQASAELVDPLTLEATRRANRKRHAASSYSELDLSTILRYSPSASFAFSAAAAAAAATGGSGSTNSSESFTHLSAGNVK